MPSISIGYAHAHADCKDINKVFEKADQAMYELKREGKSDSQQTA